MRGCRPSFVVGRCKDEGRPLCKQKAQPKHADLPLRTLLPGTREEIGDLFH